MSNTQPNNDDQNQEISADAAAVIARARRSFGFSIGLLILGFVAVALALVYRSGAKQETPGEAYSAGVLTLPAGAEIYSAVPSEGMFAIAYEVSGTKRLRLIDGKTGAIVRDIDFVSQSPGN